VLSSLGSIDRDFWDENVPCMALLLYSTRQARLVIGRSAASVALDVYLYSPPSRSCLHRSLYVRRAGGVSAAFRLR
jgi:hypothetical protein